MIGSIGFPEVVMIFIVVLLLFGPKKLPEFAKLMGKTVREFRKTINDAKATIEGEIDKADFSELKDIDRDIKDATNLNRIVEQTEIGKDLQEFKGLSRDIKNITRFDDEERKRKPERDNDNTSARENEEQETKGTKEEAPQ